MRVLLTGGAGYIGSVTTQLLVRAGHGVTVLDNLSYGHRAAVADSARLVVGDVGDAALLERLFAEERFDCVMHFAGLIRVPESVEKPDLYFDCNVGRGLVLLNAVCKHGVRRFVFSSSAAVYGSPEKVPVTEDAPLLPTSPYGDTKRVFEELLVAYERACGLRYAALRYFNVAGACGRLGEDHRPETHLIPLILRAALRPGRGFQIFGDDYPTRDGTCVRDYIHVCDLARAHLLAMEALNDRSVVYNLGSQQGYTNKEVFATAENVTGKRISVEIAGRRAGDPPELIASSERIRQNLGWQPEKNLEQMIQDAWEWHLAHPTGYDQ
ncbi:UDP-glucose 4-epimerase GalE [candidate division WOR-3 bacterium]|nr:UDP-glucose 4-epimerase GalE [candidate division WOR-3 bacterium]